MAFRGLLYLLLALYVQGFEFRENRDGYGCHKKCDHGDVHYTIDVGLQGYDLEGNFSEVIGTEKLKYFVRSFQGGYNRNGEYCMNNYNGSTGPLGPCLTVNPGQTISIRLVNKIPRDGMHILGDKMMDMKSWAKHIHETTGANVSAQDVKVFRNNDENLIGANGEVNYDATNLHFHGLEVQPHLFHPIGTSKPSAPFVTVKPNDCYCYTLNLSKGQSCGTFMYHIHRHQVEFQQGWAGMLGMIQVGSSKHKSCTAEQELAKHKIDDDSTFVLWEPSISTINQTKTKTNAKVANFTSNFKGVVKTPTLVNNAFRPVYNNYTERQVLRFRFVSGKVVHLAAVDIIDVASNVSIPLWTIAKDGIPFFRPVYMSHLLLSSGERYDILVQFPHAGLYKMVQRGISTDFGFHHAPDALLATLQVSHSSTGRRPMEPIDSWRFGRTPPAQKHITSKEVKTRRTIRFDYMGTAPYAPAFTINNNTYNFKKVDTRVGHVRTQNYDVEEWVLITGKDPHPFHIHVNPFEIISTRFSKENILSQESTQTLLALNNTWADTVLVPPYSEVVIRSRFNAGFSHRAFVGKTVYHCHWLAHSDLGMMSSLILQHKRAET
uniref:Plastocyanin-like domain-containing protein n=1 Tax=Mucochytrium quahogii TaxID=96639 RepID=A0A7S2S7Z0_9STRA|mmetsp:Transcript_32300/g.51591  ORF Transcript_32300/g.51591 Transcript_32300/m.51591 type:complete len:604 (-) Transcript_32300:1455-3266(-)|eukprot:CAMPEP_0203753074 /NCGR_PEP_ID=MMETSP0098-20131031/6889_1 /ASSEMBLY_ACC=CAM_ASM_000208 /TAXON_ID=96639 /ORGANISM=" , Strain NY0313808BC1" /LENGTH=603 /DNA_ID=CAMNT_0050643509 /DNA_START=318 /DNA_END=2129 /DNA_ORIENTATION=-